MGVASVRGGTGLEGTYFANGTDRGQRGRLASTRVKRDLGTVKAISKNFRMYLTVLKILIKFSNFLRLACTVPKISPFDPRRP